MRHCCLLSSAWGLIGVLINEIPTEELVVDTSIRPFWNGRAFRCWGCCRKVTYCGVSEEGGGPAPSRVLCRSDRLDLMVESLAIGAMNVNAALILRLRRNMAVVTGAIAWKFSGRSSTQCLILTGQLPPPPLSSPKLELEILSVDLDTHNCGNC